MRRKFICYLLLGLSLAWLAGCNRAEPSQPAAGLVDSDLPPVPVLDEALAAQGQPLYEQYCAECHGPQGEGQPNWKTPNEDGSYPAPPHDPSGHTWHHPDGLLIDLITNGREGFTESQMPTFSGQLSDQEIQAVLEYIKSWWGPEERGFQWQVTWQEQAQ